MIILPDYLNNSLGFNLNRVNTLFRRELLRVLSPYKLTPEQWQVLSILWSRDTAFNQNEIVESILKDKPTISRMIARMEKNGWIKRTTPSYDKRVTLISLTDKGREHELIIPHKVKEHFNAVLKDYDKRESSELTALLKRLRSVFDDYNETE